MFGKWRFPFCQSGPGKCGFYLPTPLLQIRYPLNCSPPSLMCAWFPTHSFWDKLAPSFWLARLEMPLYMLPIENAQNEWTTQMLHQWDRTWLLTQSETLSNLRSKPRIYSTNIKGLPQSLATITSAAIFGNSQVVGPQCKSHLHLVLSPPHLWHEELCQPVCRGKAMGGPTSCPGHYLASYILSITIYHPSGWDITEHGRAVAW